MKQLLAILLLSAAAFASTTTLTGTIKDSQGNGISGTLVMTLPVPAQDQTTNVAVAPGPTFFRLANGVITGGAKLYDVLTLQPAALYYQARAYDTAGNLVFYGNYSVSGASFNLGAAVPTTITTSNISYAGVGFTNLNNVWTGIQTIFTDGVHATNLQNNIANSAGVTGFLHVNTGIITESSVEINGGALLIRMNDAYVKLFNNGFDYNLQAGPRTTLLLGTRTVTFPEIGLGAASTVSGNWLGVSGAVNTSAPGNCLFYGSSIYQGAMLDSGFGCNTHLAFPTRTQRVQWTDGSFTQQLTSDPLSASRTVQIPDADGKVVLHGFGVHSIQSKRGTAGCATAAAVGALCTTVVTWTNAFADANYTAQCGGRLVTSGVPVNGGLTAQVAASVTFETVATTAVAAQYTNIDCTAIHD